MIRQFLRSRGIDLKRRRAGKITLAIEQLQRVAGGAEGREEFLAGLVGQIELARLVDHHRPTEQRDNRQQADRDLAFGRGLLEGE